VDQSFEPELSHFLFDYAKELGLDTPENEVETFIGELCRILIPLTLPIDQKHVLDNFKLKSMYSLWITLIDDSIDQGRDIRNDICESISTLSEFAVGSHISYKGMCGRILHDMLQGFPQNDVNGKRKLIIDMAISDLLGDLYGFFYEIITRNAQEVVTMTEYIEHSRNTIDFLFCLDCDLFYFDNVKLNEIMLLREAHRYFGMAFRLLNDLATFEKEYYVEKTPNLAALLLEKETNGHGADFNEERKKIIFGEIRLDIIENKKKIGETLSKIESFDVDSYYTNICRVLKKYPMDLESSRNNISRYILSV
jgi:hypothetical protein